MQCRAAGVGRQHKQWKAKAGLPQPLPSLACLHRQWQGQGKVCLGQKKEGSSSLPPVLPGHEPHHCRLAPLPCLPPPPDVASPNKKKGKDRWHVTPPQAGWEVQHGSHPCLLPRQAGRPSLPVTVAASPAAASLIIFHSIASIEDRRPSRHAIFIHFPFMLWERIRKRHSHRPAHSSSPITSFLMHGK